MEKIKLKLQEVSSKINVLIDDVCNQCEHREEVDLHCVHCKLYQSLLKFEQEFDKFIEEFK